MKTSTFWFAIFHLLRKEWEHRLTCGAECVVNFLAWACWSDEDFIGRVCRISRVTHPFTTGYRTIFRALMKYRRLLETQIPIPKRTWSYCQYHHLINKFGRLGQTTQMRNPISETPGSSVKSRSTRCGLCWTMCARLAAWWPGASNIHKFQIIITPRAFFWISSFFWDLIPKNLDT